MPARPLEMRSTVASALATKTGWLTVTMDRADDTDTLRHGSDGSRPSKRLHQVAAVMVVAAERLPMCRRDKALETKLFSLLCQSYVGVPCAFEAIRMKSEGGAVAVSGEDAELDAIFGIADGVRCWGLSGRSLSLHL